MWRVTFALLASKKVALFLFFALAVFLIPETLQITRIPFYKYFKILLLTLLTLNLTVCSILRFKTLQRHTLLIHLGCIITIMGSLAGNFGYIATINLYVDDNTTTAYRWDLYADTPLGFKIVIKKINREYYPVAIKIGVIDHGKQAALFQLKTGESFTYGKYRIKAGEINPEENSINLNIYRNEQLVSHYQTTITTENRVEMPEFPLSFKLVAYKKPTVKKTWLNIEVTQDGKTTKGVSGVNQPFTWNSLRIFHTKTGRDPFGKPYAGIQIVKDPGIYVVYLGFCVIFSGCLLLLFRPRKKFVC